MKIKEVSKFEKILMKKINDEDQISSLNLSFQDILNIIKEHSCDGKYAVWAIREYLKGNIQRFEDMSRVKQALTLFKNNLSKFTGQQKQLNKMSFQELETLIEPYQDVLTQNEIKRMNKEKIWSEIDVVYEGLEGKIYVPKTHEAAVFLGQGTKWCTATDDERIFEDYNIRGPLYVFVLNKKDEKGRQIKYQLHIETGQFMDSSDNDFFLENDHIVKKMFFTEILPLLNLKQIFEINDKKIFFTKSENLGNIFWGYNFYKNLSDKHPEFLNFSVISGEEIMPFDFFCNKIMNIKNNQTEDFFVNTQEKDNFMRFKNKLINTGKKNVDENENLCQINNFFTYCDIFNSSFADCRNHINKFYKDNNEYFFIKTNKYSYLFRFGSSCACIFKNTENNRAAVCLASIDSTIYNNLCKNDFELFDIFQNLKNVSFLIEKYIIRDPDIINYFEFNEEELLKLIDFNPAIIRVLDKKYITKNICKKGILSNKDLEEYIIKTYGGNYSYEEIKSMLSIKPGIIRYLFGNNQNIFSGEHKKNILGHKEILELKKFALSKKPSLIASLYYPDSELKDFVVKMDINNIKYIRSPSPKLLLYCLEQNSNIFDDMEKDTFRDKIIACDENILNLMIEKNVDYFFQKDTFRYVSFSEKNTLFFLEKIIEKNIDFVNFLSFMSYAKIQLDDMQKIKDILTKSTNPQIILYADNIQDSSDFKF